MNPLDKEVAGWLYSLGAKPHQYGGFIIQGGDYNSDQLITKWEATFFYTAFKTQREQIFAEVREVIKVDRCGPDAFDGYCREHYRPVETCWSMGAAIEQSQRIALDKLEAQLNNSNKEDE